MSMSAFSPRQLERYGMVSLVVMLGLVARPVVAPAQQDARLDGTVMSVTGNTLRLSVDPSPAYVFSEGYWVSMIAPPEIVTVDLSGIRQSDYSFMERGERIAVIGVLERARDGFGDQLMLVATSLIREPALQAP